MNSAVAYLAELPSPSQGVWHLGRIPIRAYALCILLGIVAASLITEARLRRRGAPPWMVLDIAVWAVPFGIVGARIYHVITSPDNYFGSGPDASPVNALYVWNGGLGIWGAVAGGAVGALIACRRMGLPLTFFADALAPGLPVAQAIGRLGNWFNNELYGRHTDLPWGLKIYNYDLAVGKARTNAAGDPVLLPGGPFHPTFLYEAGWNLGVALLVWLVDRRWKLGRGRAFALYVMAYTAGRFWIENMRTDEAHAFFGMRVNGWVSIVVFLGALAYFLMVRGPQEHITEQPDGTYLLVTADGEPIERRQPTRAGKSMVGSTKRRGDSGSSDGGSGGDPDDSGSSGGGSDGGSSSGSD